MTLSVNNKVSYLLISDYNDYNGYNDYRDSDLDLDRERQITDNLRNSTRDIGCY